MKILTKLLAASLLWVATPAFAADSAEPTDPAADAATGEADEPAAEETDKRSPARATPDRPTFSAAADTVDAGHLQVEVGGEFTTTDGASTLAFPLLLRAGIAESFELRAGLPGVAFPLSDEAAPLLGAIQLGAKVAGAVTDELSLGAMPYFDIATDAGEQRAFSQSTYGARLLAGYAFSDAFAVGVNLGAAVGPASTDESGPRELYYDAALTAGVSLGALAITAEGFTIMGQYADTAVGGSLSGGYKLAEWLVVDVYAGSRVQSDLTTVFAGAGVTLAQ